MRYPNKNIGRWEGNAAPPDDEPVGCEYDECDREGVEWINDMPFCSSHADDIALSNAADLMVKAAKEDA